MLHVWFLVCIVSPPPGDNLAAVRAHLSVIYAEMEAPKVPLSPAEQEMATAWQRFQLARFNEWKREVEEAGLKDPP